MLAKVQRWRDEVEVLSATTARKSTLVDECNIVKKNVLSLEEELQKSKKNTAKLCQKLIATSLAFAHKATASQGAHLAEKLDVLGIAVDEYYNDKVNDQEILLPNNNFSAQIATDTGIKWDVDSVWKVASEKSLMVLHQSQSFSLL